MKYSLKEAFSELWAEEELIKILEQQSGGQEQQAPEGDLKANLKNILSQKKGQMKQGQLQKVMPYVKKLNSIGVKQLWGVPLDQLIQSVEKQGGVDSEEDMEDLSGFLKKKMGKE